MTAQLVPLTSRDAALRALYNGSNATPLSWLCFEAALPAAGFATFFLTPVASAAAAPRTAQSNVQTHAPGVKSADSEISNGRLTLSFSTETGFLSSYADATTGINLPVSQSWLSYIGFNGSKTVNGSNQVRLLLDVLGAFSRPTCSVYRRAARTSSGPPTRLLYPSRPAPQR